MIKRVSFFLVLVQTALSGLAWAGDLDTEFEKLTSRIQDCEVSDEVKTYTLGFVDLAKSVIDVPGQLTFVSRKELEIVKCIVKFFYPLSEKKEGGMDVLNDMLEKLASQPNPPDPPTVHDKPPIDPGPESCQVFIGFSDDLDKRRVSDEVIEVRGPFKNVRLTAIANRAGNFT